MAELTAANPAFPLPTSAAGERTGSEILPNATHRQDPREARLNRYEDWVDVPLSLTAIPFLTAYAIPIIRPGIPERLVRLYDEIIIVLWVIYIIDFFIRLYLARDKRNFVRHNFIDIIAIAIPFFRPLRLLRLIALVGTFTRVGAHTLRGKLITYIVGWTFLIVLVGSLAITEAERDAIGANITTYANGLWFALGAVTDVDFADLNPVTDIGRVVGMALMLTGVALVGSVTAVLASWLVEKMTDDSNPNSPATSGEIGKLEEQVTKLTDVIGQLRGGESGAGADIDMPVPTYGHGLDPNYTKSTPWVR